MIPCHALWLSGMCGGGLCAPHLCNSTKMLTTSTTSLPSRHIPRLSRRLRSTHHFGVECHHALCSKLSDDAYINTGGNPSI
ncbi:hypothetical protein BU23DRAFT_254513 [Bimuria novae-zelandiae CBS 107.79]|uniref:Secreted protein n=1 Tax=Bimuria novae-zelandiae CBS 107.79 TaxID=1447943 RepID=A0A6A5VYN3_9PLEO|nr:hypothetical protein BU23DRAFT_254513 [Bimuria novae-zelandiae CBS 107.79]